MNKVIWSRETDLLIIGAKRGGTREQCSQKLFGFYTFIDDTKISQNFSKCVIFFGIFSILFMTTEN
jgi:hypothetical protein